MATLRSSFTRNPRPPPASATRFLQQSSGAALLRSLIGWRREKIYVRSSEVKIGCFADEADDISPNFVEGARVEGALFNSYLICIGPGTCSVPG